MTFDELVEECDLYCGGCEVFVYMYFNFESRYKNLSLANFGVQEGTRDRLINAQKYGKIEYVSLTAETKRVYWNEIEF